MLASDFYYQGRYIVHSSKKGPVPRLIPPLNWTDVDLSDVTFRPTLLPTTTAPTAAPEWFLGDDTQISCDAVCAQHGRVCSEDNMMRFNSDVDTEEEINALKRRLDGSNCSSYSATSTTRAPSVFNGMCNYKPEGTSESSYDCSKTSWMIRFCLCDESTSAPSVSPFLTTSPAPTPAPTSAPTIVPTRPPTRSPSSPPTSAPSLSPIAQPSLGCDAGESLYRFHLEDGGGDGWQGATYRVAISVSISEYAEGSLVVNGTLNDGSQGFEWLCLEVRGNNHNSPRAPRAPMILEIPHLVSDHLPITGRVLRDLRGRRCVRLGDWFRVSR